MVVWHSREHSRPPRCSTRATSGLSAFIFSKVASPRFPHTAPQPGRAPAYGLSDRHCCAGQCPISTVRAMTTLDCLSTMMCSIADILHLIYLLYQLQATLQDHSDAYCEYELLVTLLRQLADLYESYDSTLDTVMRITGDDYSEVLQPYMDDIQTIRTDTVALVTRFTRLLEQYSTNREDTSPSQEVRRPTPFAFHRKLCRLRRHAHNAWRRIKWTVSPTRQGAQRLSSLLTLQCVVVAARFQQMVAVVHTLHL